MSFWKGLAGGMAAAGAKREREEATSFSRGRASKADDLAAKALAKADARYEAALALQADNTSYSRSRDAASDERIAQSDARTQEAHEANMAKHEMDSALQMVEIFGAGAGAAGGGKGAKSGKVPSPQVLNNSMMMFDSWAGENIPDADREYFDTIGGDGKASAAVMDLIDSQAKKGNIITPETLPGIMMLAGRTEGQGKEAYEELQKSIREGNFDFKDPEAVAKGALIAKQYIPSEVLISQVAPAPEQLTEVEAYETAVQMFPNQINMEYDKAVEAGDTALSDKIDTIRGYLESDNTALNNRGLREAMKAGIGVDFLRSLDLEGNRFMPPFPDEATTSPTVTPSGAETTSPEANTGTQVSMSVEEFNSLSLQEKRELYESGELVEIGGQLARVDNPGGEKLVNDPEIPSYDESELIKAVNDKSLDQTQLEEVLNEAANSHPDGMAGVKEVLDRLDNDVVGAEVALGEIGPEVKRSVTPEMNPTEVQDSLPEVDTDVPTIEESTKVMFTNDGDPVTWGEYKQGNNLGRLRAGLPMGMSKEEFLDKAEVMKPTEETVADDPSFQDSKDLVQLLTDPSIEQDMVEQIVTTFEEKYGRGSAAAAMDMIQNN